MTVVINGTTGITTPEVTLSSWSIEESGGKLYFLYNGVVKFSIDSSGNLIVTGNVTAYGTP